MSYIETKGYYFIDLLKPNAKFMDSNFIKTITYQKINSDCDALKLLYAGNILISQDSIC